MGLFNKESAQDKQARQIQDLIDKYNLDSLAPEDLDIVRRVTNDLAGNGFFKAGMALSFAKPEDQATVTYLSALVEQNWLIINQLSRLNQKLDSIVEVKNNLWVSIMSIK